MVQAHDFHAQRVGEPAVLQQARAAFGMRLDLGPLLVGQRPLVAGQLVLQAQHRNVHQQGCAAQAVDPLGLPLQQRGRQFADRQAQHGMAAAVLARRVRRFVDQVVERGVAALLRQLPRAQVDDHQPWPPVAVGPHVAQHGVQARHDLGPFLGQRHRPGRCRFARRLVGARLGHFAQFGALAEALVHRRCQAAEPIGGLALFGKQRLPAQFVHPVLIADPVAGRQQEATRGVTQPEGQHFVESQVVGLERDQSQFGLSACRAA